jgi:hypothetical protein
VRLDLADVGDAVGAPEEVEELLSETGIAQPDVHALTVVDGGLPDKSGPAGSDRTARLFSWRC